MKIKGNSEKCGGIERFLGRGKMEVKEEEEEEEKG